MEEENKETQADNKEDQNHADSEFPWVDYWLDFRKANTGFLKDNKDSANE